MSWPDWLDWLSWNWTNPTSYNFWSSEWGGGLVKLAILVFVVWIGKRLRKQIHAHLECHVGGCTRLGHPVHGTSYRACKPHHPHHQEPITPESIAKAAKYGHDHRVITFGGR